MKKFAFGKCREKEHTVVIRELIPELEPGYVRQLQQCEPVFARTGAAAGLWIEAVIHSRIPFSPYLSETVHEWIRISTNQSRQFISLLFSMLQDSNPIQQKAVCSNGYWEHVNERLVNARTLKRFPD